MSTQNKWRTVFVRLIAPEVIMDIKLKDGTTLRLDAPKSAFEIAKQIGEGLAKSAKRCIAIPAPTCLRKR